MSPAEQRTALLEILDAINLGLVFREQPQRDFLFRRLSDLEVTYASRMRHVSAGVLPPTASLADILAEHKRNPHRVQTILELVAFQCSAEILSMAWMTLLGSRIEAISYQYSRQQSSVIEIALMLPDWHTRMNFKSSEHWDAAVLRFAALSKDGEEPVIEDFHALWIPPQAVWDHDFHVEIAQGNFGAVDVAPAASATPRWEIHQVYAKLPSQLIGSVDIHIQGSPRLFSPLPKNEPTLALAWHALGRKYGSELLSRRPRRHLGED